MMMISYLKICWQINYFLGKFYFGVLRWNFAWIGMGIEGEW